MTKATHDGTCQACGSVQAMSLAGQTTLAYHGYTRQDGWFSGSCQGTYARPMEHDTKLMESIVKQCEERVADINEWIDTDSLQLGSVSVRYQAGPIAALQTKQCWSEADRDAIHDMPTHWVEPWANALHGQQCQLRDQRDQLKGLANLLEGLRDERHGQPVYDRAQVAAAEKAEKAQVRTDKAAVREAKEAAKRERQRDRAEKELHTTCWIGLEGRKRVGGRVPVTAQELREYRKGWGSAVTGTRRGGNLCITYQVTHSGPKFYPALVVMSATLIEKL
tara:strand:- start:1629 stop:2462 length:834 start_codon:yes stop_codon:yes gene_type:complete